MRWLFVGGIWLVAVIRLVTLPKQVVSWREGQLVKVEARVDKESRLEVKGIEIWLPKDGKITFGQKIRVIGKLQYRVIGKLDSGFRLNYRDFGSIEVLSDVGTGLRAKLIQQILGWLPGDEGALASGILLGGTVGWSDEGQNSFRRVGMSHIIAASGYNVSVVIGWVMWLGVRIWGRRRSILFVLVCIIFYVGLAGWSAAVVRAGIMGAATVVGLVWGRKADGGWLLLLTGGVMGLINPNWLIDVGWQLSMAAMAGLVWVEPKIKFKKLGLSTTLAAQITTTPLIVHYFGNLSVVAPLVNMGVLWLVPYIMQIVALATVTGIGVIALLAWPELKAMTWVASEVGRLPWASLTVDKVGWGWVVCYYVALLLVLKISPARSPSLTKRGLGGDLI